MSEAFECLECKFEFEEKDPWGWETQCPNCKTYYHIQYDETWDGEEESGWFWLEHKEIS